MRWRGAAHIASALSIHLLYLTDFSTVSVLLCFLFSDAARHSAIGFHSYGIIKSKPRRPAQSSRNAIKVAAPTSPSTFEAKIAIAGRYHIKYARLLVKYYTSIKHRGGSGYYIKYVHLNVTCVAAGRAEESRQEDRAALMNDMTSPFPNVTFH